MRRRSAPLRREAIRWRKPTRRWHRWRKRLWRCELRRRCDRRLRRAISFRTQFGSWNHELCLTLRTSSLLPRCAIGNLNRRCAIRAVELNRHDLCVVRDRVIAENGCYSSVRKPCRSATAEPVASSTLLEGMAFQSRSDRATRVTEHQRQCSVNCLRERSRP